MRKRKPYPRNTDIAAAIVEVQARHPLVRPEDFVQRVIEALAEKGFYTGLVTPKRVWRVYEDMVKRKRIYDFLMVVPGESGNYPWA